MTFVALVCRCIKEIPIRSCRVVAFSHGGHLLAAASGTTVSIYNTYTCEQIGVLRCLPAHSPLIDVPRATGFIQFGGGEKLQTLFLRSWHGQEGFVDAGATAAR